MQFRFAGEAEGPFWENRSLDGQSHSLSSNEWINFGGDKCWPAPQSDWSRQLGRDWPPPVAFDSSHVEVAAGEGGLTLTSPVDPAFGIEVVRHVELDAASPVIRIRTEFRKMYGAPVTVSVWTITQMRDPERIFIPLRRQSALRDGWLRLIDREPEGLRIEDGLLSLVRHPHQCTKIGTDASTMLWVGPSSVVRIDAEGGAEDGRGEFPDGGCLTEVYTNPGPLHYVELETLGPLATLSAGDTIARTAVYSIQLRSASDPAAEAQKILGS